MLVLKTKSQKLSRVVFSPDGRGLAAAGQQGAYYWRAFADEAKPILLDAMECTGIGFTPDGAHLVFALSNGNLTSWKLDFQGSTIVPLEKASSVVVVCPATGLAVTERWSGGAMVGWRVDETGFPRQAWSVVAGPGSIGSSVAFAPDGSWFMRAAVEPLSRITKYRLVLYDPATGKEINSLRGDVWVSAGPAVSPDKEWIAYANGNFLRAQSVTNERRRETVINDNTHQYTGVAFHPSGQFLAATNNDSTVKLFDTTTWKLARTFEWDIGKMRSVCFSPDGTLAAAGSDKGKVVVWDVDL